MVSEATLQNIISSDVLKKICIDEGADDAGFVEIERKALGSVKEEVLALYPKTKTIISICIRTNPENVQGTSRSLANEEFHKTYDELSILARKIVRRLNKVGIRAMSCHPTFPMDTDRWAGKIWEISHKPIAEQAGIGKIGINRMVLHQKFGTHILLDSILIDTELDTYGTPLDYDPCVSCHLCVAACPVGAINAKKGLDFNACMTHNYRDFMGGFEDWVENIVSSKNVKEFRKKSGDDENVSKWQSLSFGPQYKAAYCVSVCPAGKDLIGIYENDKRSWVKQIVKPLKDKNEPVYVGKNTRAEEHARKNRNKEIKIVTNVQHPKSINGFLSGSRVSFEPKHARGIDMTVHFQFNGSQTRKATIKIANELIDVKEEHVGTADLTIITDSQTWLKMSESEWQTQTIETISELFCGTIIMPLFGVYGRHEISMCPLNRKESAIYTNKFFNTNFSEIFPKYKINKIVDQYHSGFEHTFLWVFDAEDAHALQLFAMDYGMTEWNELKIVPLVEFKDSVAASRKKWNIQDNSTF